MTYLRIIYIFDAALLYLISYCSKILYEKTCSMPGIGAIEALDDAFARFLLRRHGKSRPDIGARRHATRLRDDLALPHLSTPELHDAFRRGSRNAAARGRPSLLSPKRASIYRRISARRRRFRGRATLSTTFPLPSAGRARGLIYARRGFLPCQGFGQEYGFLDDMIIIRRRRHFLRATPLYGAWAPDKRDDISLLPPTSLLAR